MATITSTQRGSKKRKKSFLQNARGMGKKKNFGGGTSMDEETYSYFVRVLELLQGNFDNQEEKVALVENVLDQTKGHEIEYSSNQVGCRVIETLVNSAPTKALIPFMDTFGANLRVVTTHRFASHVLQALLSSITRAALDKTNTHFSQAEDDSEQKSSALAKDKCFEWVEKVSRFVLNNFEEFVWDEYANHVIRTVLACLAGMPPVGANSNCKESPKGPNISSGPNFLIASSKTEASKSLERNVPPEFCSILEEFHTIVSSFPQFTELAYNNLTSAMLQALISSYAFSQPKLKKKIGKQLISTVFCRPKSETDSDNPSPEVAPVFTTNASIRLLEAMLEHASSKHVSEIYNTCFKGCLIDLSCDLSTNFSVQCLLSKCADKEELGEIFEELRSGIGKIIDNGTYGVLVSLCNACKRLSVCQWSFIEAMMQALNCWEPADRRILIVPLVAHLCSYDSFEDTKNGPADDAPVAKDGVGKSNINYHGSLILQTMLTFNKPISIVKSLLNMSGCDIFYLMCDTKGSHIIDSYFKSEFVGEKNRELLLNRLEGFFPKLAISKFGSRSLEVMLAASSQKSQMKIMEELSAKADLVRSSKFGQIVASKWLLDVFQHRRNDWVSSQARKESTKEMFSKIIGKSDEKS